MSQLHEIDVADKIIDAITETPPDDMKTDQNGQLVVNTGVYRWKNGSYHDEVEPKSGDQVTEPPNCMNDGG